MYMGGVGFQQLFILMFLYISFRFQQQVKRENSGSLPRALLLLYAQYAVLTLITVGSLFSILKIPSLIDCLQVRIIFRLVEYAQGLDSSIPNHEVYQYIFDTLPMLVALVVYNVVHPGRIMPGKESDFPIRKERKSYFKNNDLEDNLESLSASQPASSATMLEEDAFQPKQQQQVPSYGYVS